MYTNLMKSEQTSDTLLYFADFAHRYQEIHNSLRWLETTTSTYFRFGTMKTKYNHLLYMTQEMEDNVYGWAKYISRPH